MSDELQSLNEAEIMRVRAQSLARRREGAETSGGMLSVLEFRLGTEHYAIEAHHVREVAPLKTLTPLPCTPAFISGIVSIRRTIVSVLDLKKFFGLPETGLTDMHRIIRIDSKALDFALLTDVSIGMREVAVDTLQSSLPTLSGIGAEYLKGVTPERLIVLDVDRILADPRIIVNEAVED